MSNMSHCRFINTLNDLKDCDENPDPDIELSEGEARARTELIQLCCDIADCLGDELDE